MIFQVGSKDFAELIIIQSIDPLTTGSKMGLSHDIGSEVTLVPERSEVLSAEQAANDKWALPPMPAGFNISRANHLRAFKTPSNWLKNRREINRWMLTYIENIVQSNGGANSERERIWAQQTL